MSQKKQILKHPVSGETKITYKGFSWPGLFFGPIWCFLKGLTTHAIVAILAGVLFPFVGTLIYCFVIGIKGNEWHYEQLIEKGYEPSSKSVEEFEREAEAEWLETQKPEHDYSKKLYE